MGELKPAGALFVALALLLTFVLPRRWAALPLLAGALHVPFGLGAVIGPFHVYVIRLLLVAALLRLMVRREGLDGRLHALDAAMLVWATWAVFASVFHDDVAAALKFDLGLVFNAGACYFVLRVLCPTLDDARRLCAMAVLLMVPVAIEMTIEQLGARNLYSVFGDTVDVPQMRGGRMRAQGPFAHAILAGTVGAVWLPLAFALWSSHRRIALVGVVACVAMILASASSGPVIGALAGVAALALWPLRLHLSAVRWSVLGALAALSAAMSAPVYYLLARIDIAGGSTGWYRARLIETAVEHLDEWWLGGTDVTGHWMPTSLDKVHADITNHYLHMGVVGGLLLMGLFALILVIAFRRVGRSLGPAGHDTHGPNEWFVWALGASLFAHAVSFMSVSYFDQSFVALYVTLAAIAATAVKRETLAHEASADPPEWIGAIPRGASVALINRPLH
jgi:hypothetical protein